MIRHRSPARNEFRRTKLLPRGGSSRFRWGTVTAMFQLALELADAGVPEIAVDVRRRAGGPRFQPTNVKVFREMRYMGGGRP